MKEPIPDHKLKWVGVDLDDTLANNSGTPEFELGEPLKGAKDFMDTLIARGFKPVIYTARGWTQYDVIEAWLEEHNIPYRRIICGKPLFYAIVDDKNIEFKGDFEEVLKKL